MSLTISNTTGDGITSNYEDYDIELPDSGSTCLVSGSVQLVGGTVQPINGSPITFPSPPASGLIYVIVQVAFSTGVVTIKQATAAMPVPDAGNGLAYSLIISPSNTDLALDPTAVTPDNT